jgi:hypothetical protein
MLLKRNGETCEHTVPGFPGLLTNSEFRAYNETFASVEWLLHELNEGVTAIATLEKQIPQLSKELSEFSSPNPLAVRAESEWQIHKSLHKSARNELLLCSRRTEQGMEFSVVEQFAHNSIYAQTHGEKDVLMTSNQASLLLQDFIENERRIFQMLRNDIVATAEESLAEKFPKQDHSRVVKAISARCEPPAQSENQQTMKAEQQARNVRIRF